MDFTGKGKTTAGKGLTGYPLAKRLSLASPSMLLPSKPLPPIQKSSPSTKTSQIFSGEQENGKNGNSYDEKSRKIQELSSEGTGYKTSLLYSSGEDMEKGSLGPPLIPPIRKAVSPPLGSAAGSLQSSLQLEFQESQETSPTCSSRSKEEKCEHAGVTSSFFSKSFRRYPSSLLPSKPLPPISKISPSSNTNKMSVVEKENKETGTGYDDDCRKIQEQSSEGKSYKVRRPNCVLCGKFSVYALKAELGDLFLWCEPREAVEPKESSAGHCAPGCLCNGCTSLLYSSGEDMKKGSLGPPLIPPIRKAVSPPLGSAAGSLQSSLQLEFQESQETSPTCSSRSKEEKCEHAASSESTRKAQRKKGKSSCCKLGPGMPLLPRKLADLFGLESRVPNLGLGNGGLGPRPAQGALAQEPQQRPPSSAGPRVTAGEDKGKAEHGSASHRGLPLSRAKEMDHPSSPGLTSDKDLRDGFRKIRAALYMLAQKNLEQKDIELLEREMKKRRQKITSLQLLPETVEPGDAAETSFSLPPADGTASRVQRNHPGSSLKKVLRMQDNVPLLPNMPIIHAVGSFPHNSSGSPSVQC
nr:uncharacterized protein LOC115493220 [Taeniopygia guttata]